MRAQALLVAVFLSAVGCASLSHRPLSLVGTWRATSQNAAGSSFEFRADRSATWHLGQPFEIQYRTDKASPPTQVDLYGFQSGPLQGRTLFCLVDVSSSSLRMDCEPTRRPAAFDEKQTQVFERVHSRAARD